MSLFVLLPVALMQMLNMGSGSRRQRQEIKRRKGFWEHHWNPDQATPDFLMGFSII